MVQLDLEGLIRRNYWETAAALLKNERGFIAPFGRRYSRDPLNRSGNYSDINKLCWAAYETVNKNKLYELSLSQFKAISRVVEELDRIYKESDTKLEQAGRIAYATTLVYDRWDGGGRAISPVDKLKDKNPFKVAY